MRRSEGCGGLTLIEVTIPIIVIVVLASLFIPKMKHEINAKKSQATGVEEFDPSILQKVTETSNRLKIVGSYYLGSFRPEVYIVFDSVSNHEYMIVGGVESVAVTVIPKGDTP